MGDVARLLEASPASCSNVCDASLKIGRTTYEGAYYQDEHGVSCLYMLGKVPTHARTVFIINGQTWYVAAWAARETAENPKFKRFHPLGEWFMLRVWNAKLPIDYGERRPYTRKPATIERQPTAAEINCGLA
jgi:hypothetical protein